VTNASQPPSGEPLPPPSPSPSPSRSPAAGVVPDPGDTGTTGRTTTYGGYLHLDRILDAQHCRSPDHNELLFIVQHQTSELWMKLMLHELAAARERLSADDWPPAFKMLARVSRIMEQLVHAWDVLATMTPSEYSAMRPHLGSSSGFQSWQYRLIEFILGNRRRGPMSAHRDDPAVVATLEAALREPSLYDVALTLLRRRGLLAEPAPAVVADPEAGERSRHPAAAIEAAWLAVYREPDRYWNLYQLAEELIDLEDAFRQWRFRHVTTVERIIGFKTGTGGTAGVPYLRRQLDIVLFPELWGMRTHL
jgi:tryptophan 2,3-dioxygenase